MNTDLKEALAVKRRRWRMTQGMHIPKLTPSSLSLQQAQVVQRLEQTMEKKMIFHQVIRQKSQKMNYLIKEKVEICVFMLC